MTPMAADEMRDFWDARAREDPFYFVDNRLRYREPDLDRFWEGGPEAVDGMLAALGARVEPADEIVEIGCGVGRLTRVLADRGASVRAVDVSTEMVELARELNPDLANVEWIVGDGRSLTGVEDSSADVCCSDVVFQHIPDPEVTLGYIREIGRALRPGGWAAFQISNAPEIHRPSPLQRLKNRGQAALGRGPGGQTHPAWLGSALDLDRLAEVARESGMSVERVVGAGTQYCRVLLRRR
jgi:SAM-dependent methyltransferase